jgi:hypothetical protein
LGGFLANGLARIDGSLAGAKQAHSQSKTLYPFLRDGGGATARSGGGVGSDVTPPVNASLENSSRVSVTSRKRVRSYHYYLAKDALSWVADCGRKKLDLRLVLVHFENWMENYHLGRFVRLTKDNEYLFIRCVNRFLQDYKRKLRKKLWPLRFVNWDLKLELTVDPKKFMRLEDEMFFMDKGWAKLRYWLLKRYGRFEFLKILEVQKSGRPHFHILISGIPYIPHEDLSEVWQKYGGGYVWIRSVRKDLDAVSYIMKYINKTIFGDNKIYAALLFASNKRMFSMSQNLMSMLNIKRSAREQGWTFQGTVDESSVKAFCIEKEIEFEDFVRITVTTEMLYEYPLLFDVWDLV